MKIVYVTGCDSKYFPLTGILLQAFKRYCPNRTLWVCDFGLTEYQHNLFSRAGILLQKPPSMRDNLHPWIYKSSLNHYLAPLSPDIVVWIDSDSFPVGPFADEVEKIVSTWQHEKDIIAICQGKVGKNWQLASPKSNMLHFKMQPDYPYYNSGVWILRSKTVLKEWAAEIETAPKNGMFEQDTFNYILYKNNISIHKFDNNQWNVTHDSLNSVEINDNGTALLNGQNVLIIHITGVFNILNISIGPFKGHIRALNNPALKNLQLQLLKEWVISIGK